MNPSCNPPSTGITCPVVFDNRGDTQQEDRFRLVFRLDRRLSQRSPGIKRGQLRLAAPQSIRASLKAISYLVSEAMTRSRGNMVLPLTTVAGAIAFTRTSGAISIASSRTR